MSKNEANNTETRREDWGTPEWLFGYLDGGCGFNFQVDLAADKNNALCERYLSKHNDAANMTRKEISEKLDVNLADEWCWCNPPYAKGGLNNWTTLLTKHNINVVALIPASVGAQWFESYWSSCDAMVFLSQRLVFQGAPATAQFDSVLYIRGRRFMREHTEFLSSIGTVVQRHGIKPWFGKPERELAKQVGEKFAKSRAAIRFPRSPV